MNNLAPLVDALRPLLASNTTTLIRLLRGVAQQIAEARSLPITALSDQYELAIRIPDDAQPWWLGQLYTRLMPGRHQQGSYYTPQPLAQYISALTLSNLPIDNSLRILDPAMGSGDFLIASAEHLVQKGLSREQAVACLYGVDVDPVAVELAALTIWLWAELPGTTHNDVQAHLVEADFLLDKPFDRLEFDVVVGNPPFVSVFTQHASDQASYRKLLKGQYHTARGSFDLTVPFVEAAVDSCRAGGLVGLVLPNKLLSASYAQPLRQWLMNNASLIHIEEPSRWVDFDANVYPVVCVWRKQPAPVGEPVKVTKAGVSKHILQADLGLLPAHSWSGVFDDEWHLVQRSLQHTISLVDIADLSAGLTVDEAYSIKPNVVDCMPDDTCVGFRLLTTGIIKRYRETWATDSVRFLKRRLDRPIVPTSVLSARRVEQASGRKLVIAGMGQRPRVLLDEGGVLASVSTVIVTYSSWPLEALCALLNSDRVAWLYRLMYGGLALSGGYLRFGKRELAALPIPDVALADPRLTKLTELYWLRIETDEVEVEINALVDSLYGLA